MYIYIRFDRFDYVFDSINLRFLRQVGQPWKTVRPLALASILMSSLQVALRFLMSDHALNAQFLTGIWALTHGGPYKWVASHEALLDMEGLADYVDALAAADMDTWAVAN